MEKLCTSVGELLGEHPTACSSRGNTLGKRVKNKYNLLPCMDGEKDIFRFLLWGDMYMKMALNYILGN